MKKWNAWFRQKRVETKDIGKFVDEYTPSLYETMERLKEEQKRLSLIRSRHGECATLLQAITEHVVGFGGNDLSTAAKGRGV